MRAFLLENPLLLLFGVAAVGYLVGKLRVFGVSLGVAAVLFAGLAVSALAPELRLPEIVHQLGLVLFVYTLGLSSGPGFFASFRRRGLRDNGFGLAILLASAATAWAAGRVAGLSSASTAGLFSGALTNTPALAAVVQALHDAGALQADEPVVAYSVAYPMGVLGVIGALAIGRRISTLHAPQKPEKATLTSVTVRIEAAAAIGPTSAELRKSLPSPVLFGRLQRGEALQIVLDDTRLQQGDLVTLVVLGEALPGVLPLLGPIAERAIDLDRSKLDFRRIFVSSAAVVGETLGALQLPQRFGAIVTRVRRGDVELLPDASMVLEPGDRVRVLAPRERIDAVSRFFGDSYKALAEIDVITFGLGIALGLLLGSVAVPLPGDASFRLGFAGGPLLVGLILGRTGRTGPLVWSLPFSASLTLRQIGLVLFLAGLGTRSGGAFLQTLQSGPGVALLLSGAGITLVTSTLALLVGRRLLKLPYDTLAGMVAGLHTQPAALAFASEQSGDDRPNAGYAAVFPMAMMAKILLAQLLLTP